VKDEKADPYNFFREYVRLDQHQHSVFPSRFPSLGSRNGAANVAVVRRPVSSFVANGRVCQCSNRNCFTNGFSPTVLEPSCIETLCNWCFGANFEREADSPKLLKTLKTEGEGWSLCSARTLLVSMGATEPPMVAVSNRASATKGFSLQPCRDTLQQSEWTTVVFLKTSSCLCKMTYVIFNR
jgi:hypothetical protein